MFSDVSNNIQEDEGELELGIVETYGVLWKILRLKPMLWMVVILLTGKVRFRGICTRVQTETERDCDCDKDGTRDR